MEWCAYEPGAASEGRCHQERRGGTLPGPSGGAGLPHGLSEPRGCEEWRVDIVHPSTHPSQRLSLSAQGRVCRGEAARLSELPGGQAQVRGSFSSATPATHPLGSELT